MEGVRSVGQLRSVQRAVGVGYSGPKSRYFAARREAFNMGSQHIAGNVAGTHDLSVHALHSEASHRSFGRCAKDIRERIDDPSIDFLCHVPVGRAQPRLNVEDRDPELGGG